MYHAVSTNIKNKLVDDVILKQPKHDTYSSLANVVNIYPTSAKLRTP